MHTSWADRPISRLMELVCSSGLTVLNQLCHPDERFERRWATRFAQQVPERSSEKSEYERLRQRLALPGKAQRKTSQAEPAGLLRGNVKRTSPSRNTIFNHYLTFQRKRWWNRPTIEAQHAYRLDTDSFRDGSLHCGRDLFSQRVHDGGGRLTPSPCRALKLSLQGG